MVSKTLASLDAWLALAEEVLAEQRELFRPTEEAGTAAGDEPGTPEGEDEKAPFTPEAA
jgi:hypothetical protein